MKIVQKTVFCVLLVLSLLSVDARADVVISNLDGNDGTQSADVNDLRTKAMGFMMADTPFILDSATLRLELFGLNFTPIIEIWSDDGGALGSSLITLNNPQFDSIGIQNYDFTSNSNFILEANTTYWLVASGLPDEDQWDWKASSPSVIPTGEATHVGALFGTTGLPPTASSGILNSYAINGTVVPEPATAGCLALLGMVALARRRR